MKLFNRILLIILVALVSIGFVPYKIPVSSDLSENELLIEFSECTCCGEYGVNKHLFHFPKEYQIFYPEGKNFDLRVVDGAFPIEKSRDFRYWQNLIVGNQFKIKGTIVGVDSTDYSVCRNYIALFNVSEWETTRYKPMFFTFSYNFFWLYFISVVSVIILLFFLAIVRFVKRER